MEMQHTEGQWSLKHLDNFSLSTKLVADKDRIVADGNGVAICIGAETELAHIYALQDGLDNEAREKEHKANAYLIAAAPDMLEALEIANAQLHDLTDSIYDDGKKKIQQAIAKAKGEA